jgi:hypothetical protein
VVDYVCMAVMDNAKRTGVALEAHHKFLVWLLPTVEKFPRSDKFTLGDRIESTGPSMMSTVGHNGSRYRGRAGPGRRVGSDRRRRPLSRMSSGWPLPRVDGAIPGPAPGALLPYLSNREREQRTPFVAFAKPPTYARFLREGDSRCRRRPPRPELPIATALAISRKPRTNARRPAPKRAEQMLRQRCDTGRQSTLCAA